MCGLNGIFGYGSSAPAPSPEEARLSSEAQARRGPDGEGFWSSASGRCLLAHRRLSIIDLSDRGKQPMHSAGGRYTIVYNGEIYNYPELRAAAIANGIELASDSDTEILLHLYAARGPAMLAELRGMFAFAIWDETEQSLFLARDPFGIKPLYYSDQAGTFRFASQVRGLLAGGAIDRAPNPAGVIGFLLLGSVPEPFTWFEAISALPAGHHVTVTPRGVGEPVRYADPASALATTISRGVTREESMRQGVQALRESVRAHLLADVPVGLFLSSGIDSASILGIASDFQTCPLRCITLGFREFEGTPEDEVPLASRLADYYGAKHEVRWVDQDEFSADLDALFGAMDQPSIDGVNTWFVAKAAHSAGLKVAMSGIGGDELLGGYSNFSNVPGWHRRFRMISNLPALAPLLERGVRVAAPRLMRDKPKITGLFRHAGTIGTTYFVARALRMPEALPAALDAGFAAEGLRRLELRSRMNAPIDPRPDSDQAAVTLLELAFYARNQLLRDADWAGMAHSLEIRTPLLDFALFEALGPLIGHLRPGEGKQLLASAPAKPLPEWIRNRAKTGFTVPYAHWMQDLIGRDGAGPLDPANRGDVSRRWANYVLDRYAAA
ncbi:asparagine synthase (glutamine-hydrolyzing) [Sphingomonas sp.]|uniref:asparagine synthase (glutamine-hydrolyzing) n=1 Tax=Sphingomonas sp. TaxID=28214 RepID=UPI001AFEF987|nr:asparagine synthase (glutamine-hydrolyzing) [Sphingomonas sp.]MBO9711495.1 asparagine synthase (glutamine-hydrolyzing) [Sphingomonas sp.]